MVTISRMTTLLSGTFPSFLTVNVSLYFAPGLTDFGLAGSHGGSIGAQSFVRLIFGLVLTLQVAVTGGRALWMFGFVQSSVFETVSPVGSCAVAEMLSVKGPHNELLLGGV